MCEDTDTAYMLSSLKDFKPLSFHTTKEESENDIQLAEHESASQNQDMETVLVM